MAKKIKKFLKSFTLIELIIVIAIIAVLGATAFLLLSQWMSKSRDAQRISDLAIIKTGLDIALTKNDELPLPDEANVLLYSGTEILYQGKFGDQVVKSIGTLNKVPKDRQTGEYEYSLLYDKKSYRVKAEIENEQYLISFINKVKANNNFYRYIGKNIKAVVVKDVFVYLPSMFISGYNDLGKYDLYLNDLDVFVGDKIGDYKTGLVLPLNNLDKIKTDLSQLGLDEDQILQIITQGTGQPQIKLQDICGGVLPIHSVINGNQKSGQNWTYNEDHGDCNFKCEENYNYNDGSCLINTFSLSGTLGPNGSGAKINICGTNSTADELGNFSINNVEFGTNCESYSIVKEEYLCTINEQLPSQLIQNINIGGNCVVQGLWSGNALSGFNFTQLGVQMFPKSCNDLLVSANPNFKSTRGGIYNGTKFEDGVYWVKPNTNPAYQVYCDMSVDGGGWTMVAQGWNKCFDTSVNPKHKIMGAFITTTNSISYNKARLTCSKTSASFDNVLNYSAARTDLTTMNSYSSSYNISGSSAAHGTSYYQGYTEWHRANGKDQRYIIRTNITKEDSIHCYANYVSVGSNCNLGQYGSIYIK